MLPQKSVRFGPFEADVGTGELRKHGIPVKLQEQPAKILAALLESPGAAVSREDLIKLLWADGTFVDYDRGLNAAINRLRQALSDSAESPRYVETVARRGYRFIAPVEAARGGPEVPAQATAHAPRRWPWIAGALAAIAFSAGVWLWRSRSEGPQPAATPVPLTSYDGIETEPSFSPDGTQVAFAWNGPAQDNFDIYVKVIGAGAAHRVTTDPASDRGPAWSPDGRYVAFVREKQGIFVIPPVGGVERRLVAEVKTATRVSWSADSRYLAFTRYPTDTEAGGIFLVGVNGGQIRRLTAPGIPDSARAVAFSPNGRLLAFDQSLIELDESLNPRGPAKPLARRPALVDGLTWTSDGSAVVLSEWIPGLGLGQGSGQQLVRVGIRPKREPQPLSFAGQGTTMATISRSGARLAYSKTQANTDIWKLEDGVITRSPLSSTFHDGSMQYSPDGSRVAFSSSRSGNEEIWVANADGSDAVQLTNSIASGTPRWSPDGRQIVYDTRSPDGNWHIRIMDAAGGPSRQLTPDGYAPSFSRDGKWVYYATRRGVSRVSPSGGEPVVVAPTPGGRAAFESSDGRFIYYTVGSGCSPLFVRSSQGGPEKIVADPVCFRAFAVTARGVYYVSGSENGPSFTVHFLDSATGKSAVLGESKGLYLGQGLTVSPDGETILLSASSQTGADLYLVENFR